MADSENRIDSVRDRATSVQAGVVHGGVHVNSGGTPFVPRQLAAVPRHFTDRRAEFDLLESHRTVRPEHGGPRLILLRGLPGVGKTALATKWLNTVAGDYSDGQLLLDLGGPGLAAAADPPRMFERLLAGLGVDPCNIPQGSEAQSGMFRSLTADRALALLLDDAVSAGQVAAALPASAHALVVVTCTPRLPFPEADVVEVGPMETAAIAEYLDKALPADKAAAAPEGAVHQLAERCRGLPQLAHMAVRRLSEDPLESVAALTERFDGADAAPAQDPDEQVGDRTVDAEIGVFFRALSPAAARMYRVLGLHPGPEFDLWAAAAGAGTEVAGARAALIEIWRNGLLDHVQGAAEGRFRFSEIVGRHAESEAGTAFGADAAAAVLRSFAAYYRAAALAAAVRGTRRWLLARMPDPAPALPPVPTNEAARAWMAANAEAVLAAAQWSHRAGDHSTVCDLAEAADGYLRENGRYADRLALMRVGIDSAVESGAGRAEARLRNQYGLALVDLARVAEAVEEFSRALHLSRQDGDGRGQGAALECLGIAEQRRGADEPALEFFARAEPFKAAMGRPQAMAVLGMLRARSLVNLGRTGEAVEPLAAALAVFEEPDGNGDRDEVNTAKTLLELGRALTGSGRPQDGMAELERALEIFARQGHIYQQARVREAMADADRARSAPDWERHGRAAVGLYRAIANDVQAERVAAELPGGAG